jgi:hypothetical protein
MLSYTPRSSAILAFVAHAEIAQIHRFLGSLVVSVRTIVKRREPRQTPIFTDIVPVPSLAGMEAF